MASADTNHPADGGAGDRALPDEPVHRDRRRVETRICGGGFGIFGHGNVPCLGEALYPVQDEMPLYRGQNEQSMGFAAAAYAKYHLRRRFMFCTASAGPGTANLLTASALAHANRLPMLMLCGDTFLTRLPDPVLQQLEHFGNPAIGLNDAFKAVTRYWDRITHPAQIIQSLPAALATMLDPADCGPAFIGLPQDVQGWAYDYPESFFAPACTASAGRPPTRPRSRTRRRC
jgi:3D-(3,5/4)-trihydroxycyclohexane-1,2-dione acylhydrolase (decyclizing)